MSPLLLLRRDNCCTWVEDFAAAQDLANQQLHINWEAELDRLLDGVWMENGWSVRGDGQHS